ncbi:hypothetical protein Tco_1418526 [Tanacetum coccineum]
MKLIKTGGRAGEGGDRERRALIAVDSEIEAESTQTTLVLQYVPTCTHINILCNTVKRAIMQVKNLPGNPDQKQLDKEESADSLKEGVCLRNAGVASGMQ